MPTEYNEFEEKRQTTQKAARLLQEKLEEEKQQRQQQKQQYKLELTEQIKMKEEARNTQLEEDVYFQRMAQSNLNESEDKRKIQHKQMMDRYLGDYDN